MNKAACKTQLRTRLKRTHSRKERGKALGAYQKCLKSRRGRRGKHYKYWKGGWGED